MEQNGSALKDLLTAIKNGMAVEEGDDTAQDSLKNLLTSLGKYLESHSIGNSIGKSSEDRPLLQFQMLDKVLSLTESLDRLAIPRPWDAESLDGLNDELNMFRFWTEKLLGEAKSGIWKEYAPKLKDFLKDIEQWFPIMYKKHFDSGRDTTHFIPKGYFDQIMHVFRKGLC